MLTQRQLFLQHVAQTSPAPMALEIVKAEGMYLYDAAGKRYMDLIAGISVSNVGHCHPAVVKAIKEQVDQYMHLMVYGEYVQSPQVALATLLTAQLPTNLNSVYFVNSGSEAVEGAMKLAKRYTGRTQIIAFKKAYHGSTQGSLSIMGDEYFKNAYRPLLPDILHLDYNDSAQLESITHKTACVIAETVQGEAGAVVPNKGFLAALRKKCTEVGALLVLDEIQTGFGRTGSLYAFMQEGIVPDILLTAKGMGGGMPIGAFIASKDMMDSFTHKPVLGHITTFGGHPVCCAASLATLKVLLEGSLISSVPAKEQLFRQLLNHPAVKTIHGKGLLLALEFESADLNMKIISECIVNGVITDWFLFADNKMRIAPPLIITEEEITQACGVILKSIEHVLSKD